MSVQSERGEPLAESEIFHVLGNDRRRAIVQLLAGRDGRLEVSEVATAIADEETGSDSSPENLYKSVYVSLQQTHLPRLEEDAIIVYDDDAKTIEPGPNFGAVVDYVDGDGSGPAPILLAHLVACTLGLVVVAVSGTSLPVVSALEPVFASVVVFVAVAASSLYGLLG